MNAPVPNDELEQLLKRMELEELSATEKDRLNQLLRDDEEVLTQFIRYSFTDAMLAWLFTPVSGVGERPLEVASVVDEASAPRPWLMRHQRGQANRRRGWPMAAAALLAGVIVGYSLAPRRQNESNESPMARRPQHAAVATLTFISRDVRWEVSPDRTMQVGTVLEKGWIHLAAGTIDLTFRSGATVRIDGPASFAIDSPLRGFLNYGKLRVHAPETARDFVVGTASMEVVDLGTEFNLSVSRKSGDAEVDVVEGLVDLNLFNAGGANRIQALGAGQSAAVDASGKITAIKGGKLDPRLLSHWRLDDNAENSLVIDASPNKFHARLNVPTSERTQQGKTGRALALRSDGYVDFSQHLKALTSTKSFTLAAWVRNADDIVFSVSDGTATDRIQFELHGPRLYYGWQQGEYFDRISAGVSGWEPDRWYHIAVSISGDYVTIFRDGRALIEPKRTGGLINTRAIAPIDLKNPSVAYLGRLPSNHVKQQQFLGGDLDDVQLYGSALDEETIRYLFEHPGSTLSLEGGR